MNEPITRDAQEAVERILERIEPSLELPDRNLVPPEVADENRRRPGSYTFNAPVPREYEGVAVEIAVLRLGDHAHLDVQSGYAVAGASFVRRGEAGRLVLRWDEWLKLRPVLAAHEWIGVHEVECPSPGNLERHAAPAGEEKGLVQMLLDGLAVSSLHELSDLVNRGRTLNGLDDYARWAAEQLRAHGEPEFGSHAQRALAYVDRIRQLIERHNP